MSASRQQVVDEALTWLRTPYHAGARVRGVGVDCAMFPASVYEAVGLIGHVDPKYPHDWHLHRNEELYVEWILRCGATEVSRDDAHMGDMGVWRWGRTFSHGAILLGGDDVIHSWVDLGVTIDSMRTHEELRTRESRFFTLWVD